MVTQKQLWCVFVFLTLLVRPCFSQAFPDVESGNLWGRDLRTDEHLYYSYLTIDWTDESVDGLIKFRTTNFGASETIWPSHEDRLGHRPWDWVEVPVSSTGERYVNGGKTNPTITNFFAIFAESKYITFDELVGSWSKPADFTVAARVIDGFRIGDTPYVRAQIEGGNFIRQQVSVDLDGKRTHRFPYVKVQLFNFSTGAFETIGKYSVSTLKTEILAKKGRPVHIGEFATPMGNLVNGTRYRIILYEPSITKIPALGDPVHGPWFPDWEWKSTVFNEGYYTYTN